MELFCNAVQPCFGDLKGQNLCWRGTELGDWALKPSVAYVADQYCDVVQPGKRSFIIALQHSRRHDLGEVDIALRSNE